MADRRRAPKQKDDVTADAPGVRADSATTLTPPQRKVAQLQHDAGNQAVLHMGVQRAAMMGVEDKKEEAAKSAATGPPSAAQTSVTKSTSTQPAARTMGAPSTAMQVTKVVVAAWEPGKTKEVVGKAAASSSALGTKAPAGKGAAPQDDKVASVTADMYEDQITSKEWKKK